MGRHCFAANRTSTGIGGGFSFSFSFSFSLAEEKDVKESRNEWTVGYALYITTDGGDG